jgi:hypothetical protein
MRLVHKCLNKSISQRTISKQEAMCELAKLPAVICSETIESVSLSGYTKLHSDGMNQTSTILSRYKNRAGYENLSLHQYFHMIKNGTSRSRKEIIPHYVGGSGQPCFPVSQSYARTELMKHMPWSSNKQLPPEDDMIATFQHFIDEQSCPLSVKLSFERSKLKVEQFKRGYQERVVYDQIESNPIDGAIDEDTSNALLLTQPLAAATNEIENIENDGLDLGKEYDWSKRHFKTPKNGDMWLNEQIKEYNEKKDNHIRIPKARNNEPYKLKNLNNDQFRVAYVILNKVRQWVNLKDATVDEKKKSSHFV